MNDDLNSPIVIAHLFDGARMINTVLDKKRPFPPKIWKS